MCKTVNLLVILVFSVLLWSFDYGSGLTVWGFWWYCGLSCPDDDQCLEFVPPPLCRICVTVLVFTLVSLLVVSCFTLKVSFLLCPAWVWLHFSDLAWWFSPAVRCFLLCAVVVDLVMCSLALGSLVHLKKCFVTLCWCLCPVQLFSTTRPAPFNFSCAGKKVSGDGLQPTCF